MLKVDDWFSGDLCKSGSHTISKNLIIACMEHIQPKEYFRTFFMNKLTFFLTYKYSFC